MVAAYVIGLASLIDKAIVFSVSVDPPVISRGHHDGPDVGADGQLLFGVVILLIVPQHGRVAMALGLVEDSNGLSLCWVVWHENYLRQGVVNSCVFACCFTSSRLAIVEVAWILALTSISLRAESNSDVSSALPAAHRVVKPLACQIVHSLLTATVFSAVVSRSAQEPGLFVNAAAVIIGHCIISNIINSAGLDVESCGSGGEG